jgi:AcrR family transcriptional regulator
MGGSDRRRREREARRRSILDAARELIATEGLGALTMERVAEGAELAKGTLYLQFAGRGELLAELVIDWLDGMSRRFADARASVADPLGAMEAIGRAWALYAAETADLAPLLEQARTRVFLEGLGTGVQARLAEANARPHLCLAAAVGEAQARGQLAADRDPLELALELAAFSMGVLELCLCLRGSSIAPDPDNMLSRAWSRLLDPLLATAPNQPESPR